MSRRQAIPSNWFVRDGDPLPPLYPEPSDGDHYYNRKTGKLRVFIDGQWEDTVILGVDADGEQIVLSTGPGLTGGGPLDDSLLIGLDTTFTDTRYVNHDQMTVSTAAPSGTPAGGVGSVWIQY